MFPLPSLSQDNRGIELVSPDQAHEAIWGNYHALIIGINAYQEWNPLQTAVKDAEGWYEILTKRYGFAKENVILRTDSEATADRIMSDLRSLATSLESSDNLLLYYAGHGQLDDITGDGYWIPVEGKLKKPNTWISQYRIKSILSSEKIKGKNIVVVADSCYSGIMLRGGPSLLPLDDYGYQMKLEKAASRRSRQVITSGGVEPVADGGRDGHSLFAYYFLKALKENNREVIDIENLFHTRVWKYVTEIGDQRPNVGRFKTSMDDDGQFVLIDNESIARKLEHRDRKRRELEQIKTQMAEKQKLEAQRRELEQMKSLMEEKLKLEAERRELEQEKSLMEEKLKLEAQRRELEQLKALTEREKLEAERRQAEQRKMLMEERKKLLASIPMDLVRPKVVLRRRPIVYNSAGNIKNMLKNIYGSYNFYDSRLNKKGDFQNDFFDNGDNTVTDKATGLMWQKGGSSKKFEYQLSMKIHIRTLNRKQFAGFSDWRLPTLEELASLLEPKKMNENLFIDPVFTKASPLASSDYIQGDKQDLHWAIDFSNGHITHLEPSQRKYLPPSLRRDKFPNQCRLMYVKAVRHIK